MVKGSPTPALKSTARKAGRPHKPYRTSWGASIDGLRFRKHDRRWVVVATGEMFREPDERLAVAHFQALVAASSGSNLGQLTVHSNVLSAFEDLNRRTEEAGGYLQADLVRSDDSSTYSVRDHTLSPAQWAWLRTQLFKRPKWVAERVGVEQIGYLTELKPPAISPKLTEVGKLYTDRTDIGEKETSKCATTWADFSRMVQATTLRELTPEAVSAWGVSVKKKGLAAKTTYHAFNRVKTILNHFRTTGRAIDDVRHALDCCAVLKAPETTSLDPHPITRSTFAKLLEKAEAEGKAMLLVALNLCFYPIDLVRLTWSDLDLERGLYHAKRGKTKVARAGVLWKRTVDALAKIERVEDSDKVFHKANGQPHTDTTIRKWFWAIREAAGVPKDVQFADIRDGSFTEAVAGEGVEFQHARVLAGHRSGIADAYVLRNPRMVAKACAAVELAYFG